MTYHLDPGAPLADEIRAVALDQIDRAARSLDTAEDDLEAAVHDARKRFKKLRALLRLVRPGLGDFYTEENRRLRDLGRSLAPVRDAQVLCNTLAGLSDGANTEAQVRHIEPLRDWAEDRRAKVIADKDMAQRLGAAREGLTQARRRFDGLALPAFETDCLKGGLKKTYGRARARGREARAAPAPARLHEWRKRVKYHWYHCRLLREAWPAVMVPRIDALDRLADDLGDDHDLAVLLDQLTGEARKDVPPQAREVAQSLAVFRGQTLRARALDTGPYLLVEKPKALARRLTGHWSQSVARAG